MDICNMKQVPCVWILCSERPCRGSHAGSNTSYDDRRIEALAYQEERLLKQKTEQKVYEGRGILQNTGHCRWKEGEKRVEERVTESKLGTIMENTLVPYRGAEEKKVAVAILIHICNLSWDALTSQHLECDVDLDMFANITGEHS